VQKKTPIENKDEISNTKDNNNRTYLKMLLENMSPGPMAKEEDHAAVKELKETTE
jgi:hypothetical protein